MEKSVLEQVGLSKGESEIYLVLIKIGESIASDIAKHTKIARPNVYDYLNKLKEKGFVSFVNKNNKTYYIPASPEKILEYIEEKKSIFENSLKELLTLYQPNKEMPKIEVYEGSEGFKILINDIIKTKEDFVGWGGSNKVKDYVEEHIIKRYLNLRKKYNIKARLLYVEKESILKTPLTKFRSIPKEYSSPSTVLTYSDKVAMMIYTAMPGIIIIKNKELAQSYKTHFEILWKASKK